MKRFSFGSSYSEVTSVKHALEMSDEQKEAFYRSLAPENRKGPLGVKGYEIVGSYRSHVLGDSSASKGVFKRANERLARGLWPLTDEDFAKIREHARRTSAALKDLVRDWVNNEEFDAFQSITHDSIRENRLVWSVLVAQVQANIARGLKEGNPDCTVAVLGPCCYDYFWEREKFNLTRRLLSAMRGSFDYLAIDAYSGNWNRMRNRYTPPEESFAKLLSDAADLSAEYGGCREVANVERCAGIDWRAAYDSEQAVDQADYTMRSMIIGRTVTNALCYCLHLTAYLAPAKAVRKDPTKEPPADLGIWRAVMPADGTYRYVPRPAAVAAATTVRLLSFTRDPRLVRREDGVHVATFAAPGGDDGKALAAVWTADAAFEGEIDLPSGVTRIDSAGNETECPAGRWRGRVSPTPFFLRAAASARPALEKALGACRVIRFDESAGPAPILVPKGALPKAPAFALTGPGDIFPSRAVMPEAGYFPAGTTVFPSAEAKFAWDEEGLSAEVTVRHKEHVQRRSGKGVDNDDCVLFSFYDASPLSEDHPRRASHAVNFIAALGTDGPHGFVWDYDRKTDHRPCGTVAAETSAGTTVYRVRMPWRDILPGFRPAKGKSLAFNLRCPFAASRTDWTAAPYMLVLQKQKSRIFQMYHAGFLDSCRQLRLD